MSNVFDEFVNLTGGIKEIQEKINSFRKNLNTIGSNPLTDKMKGFSPSNKVKMNEELDSIQQSLNKVVSILVEE